MSDSGADQNGANGPVCHCGQVHLTRTGRPACRAHSRHTGEPCKSPPIDGGTVCRMHGGAIGHVKRKAQHRQMVAFTEGAIAKLLKECDIGPDVHPIDGLLQVVRHSGAMFRMLSGLVGELDVHPDEDVWTVDEAGEIYIRKPKALYGPDHKGDGAPHILVNMYAQWADRYARACKLALDANIDERLVRSAEATSSTLFNALGRALDSVDLQPEQIDMLQSALALELRRSAGPQFEGIGAEAEAEFS